MPTRRKSSSITLNKNLDLSAGASTPPSVSYSRILLFYLLFVVPLKISMAHACRIPHRKNINNKTRADLLKYCHHRLQHCGKCAIINYKPTDGCSSAHIQYSACTRAPFAFQFTNKQI